MLFEMKNDSVVEFVMLNRVAKIVFYAQSCLSAGLFIVPTTIIFQSVFIILFFLGKSTICMKQ